ncbi:MAG: hypothetical protein RMI91_14580 [Gemmatales bacterium]|nr:hypothetical protein [Gemmatales bacterium]
MYHLAIVGFKRLSGIDRSVQLMLCQTTFSTPVPLPGRQILRYVNLGLAYFLLVEVLPGLGILKPTNATDSPQLQDGEPSRQNKTHPQSILSTLAAPPPKARLTHCRPHRAVKKHPPAFAWKLPDKYPMNVSITRRAPWLKMCPQMVKVFGR